MNAPAVVATIHAYLQRSAAKDPHRETIATRMENLMKLVQRNGSEAQIHMQRGAQLAAEGKNSQAIAEYQAAQRLYPTPSTLETISKLRTNSLGL
jgi:hypothetical protein